jgi:hypothetical protein
MGQFDGSLAVFAKGACKGFSAKCGGCSMSAILSPEAIVPFALQPGEKLIRVKDAEVSK